MLRCHRLRLSNVFVWAPGRANQSLLAGSLAARSLWVIAALWIAACSRPPAPVPAPPTVTLLVPGSSFHGVHGLTWRAAAAGESDGKILAGSVVGAAMYEVDPASGAVRELIAAPLGMTDDLEFSPDGTQLAWTSFLLGKVHARAWPDGEIVELASGLPGANSIAYRADGRLFFSQVFAGDALWELDPQGGKPPRKILENIGGLNGFDFGPDGLIYGPLWFDQRVVKIDVDKATITTVADGFATPAAVNFDSTGRLWVVDTERGEVVRVDPQTGAKTVIAHVEPSIDNLAFAPDDRLFISNMAHNAVYQIDTTSGAQRSVVEGKLSMPAGLALWSDDGVETLYLADTFAYRTIAAKSGVVTDVRSMHAQSLDELDYPIDASASAEHVLLTSWSSSTVQTVDRRSGAPLEMWHGFAAPSAAVELEDGRVVVAEIGAARLLVVSGEHGANRLPVAEGKVQLPVDLLRAGGSAVYVSDAAAGAILRIDVDSGEVTTVVEGLAQPEGFDLLPDGRLVVAEVAIKKLTAVDLETGERTTLAEELPVGLAAPPGIFPSYVPTGVAASRSESAVFVVSDLENAIYRVAVNGGGQRPE